MQLSRMVTQTTATQPPPRLWPAAPPHKGHFSSLGCRRMLLPQPDRGRVSWAGLHLSFLPDHRAALTDGGQGARVIFFFLLHEAEEGFRLASAMVQPPHASCWTHAGLMHRGVAWGTLGFQADPSGKWREKDSLAFLRPYSPGTGAQRLCPCHMTGCLHGWSPWEPGPRAQPERVLWEPGPPLPLGLRLLTPR